MKDKVIKMAPILIFSIGLLGASLSSSREKRHLVLPSPKLDTAVSVRSVDTVVSVNGKKVLFIGKSPEWEADLPKIVLRKMRFHDPTKRTWDKVNMDAYSADKLLQKSFINSESAQFVSLNDFFCNSEGCLIFLGDDLKNGITSYDSNHLTPMASNVLAKELLIPLMIKN